MRGVSIVNKFRYLIGNKFIVSSLFVMAVAVTGVGAYQFNQTSADAATNCAARTNDIVPGGTSNYGAITQHYNGNTCGDVKDIYDHYWIKPHLAAGERAIDGVANNRGEIVADGRVVATNATSIGRHNIKPGTSKQISIKGKTYYETTHQGGAAFANPGGSLAVVVVLDKDGNFVNAIVKACGNPIHATPNNPPKPPEPPKPEPPKEIKVCELESKKIITIKEDEFDAKKHSKNLEDCKENKIKVCELESKKIIIIDEKMFDEKKHSKNLEDCKEVKIEVCELESKKIITIDEKEFDEKKHSKNLKDCEEKEITVCERETKNIIKIKEDEFDEAKHSRDLKDCEEVPTPVEPTPPTPTELPKTGAVDILGASFGLTSITLASYYYYVSRRNG